MSLIPHEHTWNLSSRDQRPIFCSEGGASGKERVRGRENRGFHWAPHEAEEPKRWKLGHPPVHRTHRLGHPLGPIAPPPLLGWLDWEGTTPQVAELRDQVARSYLQLLKFSLQLMPLAFATLQLAGHGAMVQGGGGSRSVARPATSTPRPPAH